MKELGLLLEILLEMIGSFAVFIIFLVIGTYYPTVSLNMDKINNMVFHAPIFYDKECKLCPYKYLCLGGCPLIAGVQNQPKVCGIYVNESILDNLSCNPEEIRL